MLDFLLELIAEVVGDGLSELIKSPKVALSIRIALLTMLCALLIVLMIFILIGNNFSALEYVLLIGILLFLIGLWIFGMVRILRTRD